MATFPFGVIAAGSTVITEPTSVPSESSFLYALPAHKRYSHVVVFLVPGVTLPPDTAAAIYIATADEVTAATSSGRTPNFKFLGAVGQGKESSVFKITSSTEAASPAAQSQLVVGISIEPAATVSTRLSELPQSSSATPAPSATTNNTVLLAQKIIRSAFNFLASFSGTAGPNQPEVVPLKAFEEWWQKYESRLRSDPSFLDRHGE
ncbi:hypothetical protein jhhlp_003367 [Lomentospora prolificans]|uniref:Uncharacterized protein n=1 Tax=Lomentospora prolificans TaxID=41688 RepID=A0A2N3NGX0_9PEZI|nr:hypothetical protein jhhlp_003367 [Lomentospora prolificans]